MIAFQSNLQVGELLAKTMVLKTNSSQNQVLIKPICSPKPSSQNQWLTKTINSKAIVFFPCSCGLASPIYMMLSFLIPTHNQVSESDLEKEREEELV